MRRTLLNMMRNGGAGDGPGVNNLDDWFDQEMKNNPELVQQKAHDICFEVMCADKPFSIEKQIEYGKRALKVDPGNVMGFNCLAQAYYEKATEVERKTCKHETTRIENLQKALDFTNKAIESAYKLTPGLREATSVSFSYWSDDRPYMRALHRKSQIYETMDNLEEAINVGLYMMEINPEDNQGMRDTVLTGLISLKRYKEARFIMNKLLSHQMGICSKDCLFAWLDALLAFVLEEDNKLSKLYLALKHNPMVARYLLNPDLLPQITSLDDVILGGEEQSKNFVFHFRKLWVEIPGSLEWVTECKKSNIPSREALVAALEKHTILIKFRNGDNNELIKATRNVEKVPESFINGFEKVQECDGPINVYQDFRMKERGPKGGEDHVYNFLYKDIISVPFYDILINDSLQPLAPSCCWKCGVTAENKLQNKLQKCGRCRFAEYCGVACQKNDWPEHKKNCVKGQGKGRKPEPTGHDMFNRVLIPPYKHNPIF